MHGLKKKNCFKSLVIFPKVNLFFFFFFYRCGVLDRLKIHHDEWGTSLPSCLRGNHFDAIVSNPPYIATRDLKNVDLVPQEYK